MNKKTTIIAVIALIVLVAGVAAAYFLIGPEKTDTGATVGTDAAGNTLSGCSFTVTVVHADQTETTFSYTAPEGKLGAFLEAEGLILSEGADSGMFHTVDGEKADWNENQSYWAFYLGEEYAMVGIYDTDIEEGADYKLVYTLG